jgi:protein-S-isoprenylcysteine O-methyltransferase Ste14
LGRGSYWDWLDYNRRSGGEGISVRIGLFKNDQGKLLKGFSVNLNPIISPVNTQTANSCLGVHPKEKAMHLLDQRILGLTILFLLGVLVVVKRMATGSILDRPKGSIRVQLVNGFNLFFLLMVNPMAAVLLIIRRLEIIDSIRIIVHPPWLLTFLETAGLVFFVMGYLLMDWALFRLGDNYQLGGSTPRSTDAMVMDGPYRWVRHPMYTAALTISLGLALLTQSWAFLGVFDVYLVLILMLIPLEEQGLQQAYTKQYTPFQQRIKRLIPFVY